MDVLRKAVLIMLLPAQLFAEELKLKNAATWYDTTRYMYWHGGCGASDIVLSDNTYENHQFVSVDKNDKVLGYISYCVDWNALSADRFGAVSFDIGNAVVAKDLAQAIDDIFRKYHLNRVEWMCYTDNPAIRGYRTFIKKCGGKECAYYRQVTRLLDGKLHDAVSFEILASEYNGVVKC